MGHHAVEKELGRSCLKPSHAGRVTSSPLTRGLIAARVRHGGGTKLDLRCGNKTVRKSECPGLSANRRDSALAVRQSLQGRAKAPCTFPKFRAVHRLLRPSPLLLLGGNWGRSGKFCRSGVAARSQALSIRSASARFMALSFSQKWPRTSASVASIVEAKRANGVGQTLAPCNFSRYSMSRQTM